MWRRCNKQAHGVMLVCPAAGTPQHCSLAQLNASSLVPTLAAAAVAPSGPQPQCLLEVAYGLVQQPAQQQDGSMCGLMRLQNNQPSTVYNW